MEGAIKVLGFLKDNPQLSLPLALMVLMWPAAKRAVAALDARFTSFALQALSDQTAIFILLIHLITVIVLALIFFGATDVPPPAFRPKVAELYGVGFERLMGYMLPIWLAFINMLGIWFGAHVSPVITVIREMLGPRMAVFGLVFGIVATTYSAYFDPSPVGPVPQFQNRGIAVAWWYTTVPTMSIILTVSGYLIGLVVGWIWSLSGKLSK